MTQFGEKAMQYISLEPCKVPEALKLYAEVFQAKIIDHCEDQSVQLKILNSYVIIIPLASPGSDSNFLELPTDLNSIGRIRHDKRFVEIDRKRPTENESVMMKDPFGVTFLLIERKKTTRSGLLFSRKCNAFAYQIPQDIMPNELCTIKLTALFVVRYGISFIEALKKIAASTTEFEFLNLDHIRRLLLFEFVDAYTLVVEPSNEPDRSCDFMGKALEFFFHLLQLKKVKMEGVSSKSVMGVDAFTGGADYFAYMDIVGYTDVVPRPQRRSVMIAQLGQTLRTPLSVPPFPSWCTISPEVLGVIKLTALFAARYGKRIGWELKEKVGKKPLFSFLDPSDCEGFPCYNMFVKVYSKVLMSFEMDYTTDIVLERYFQCLQWDEEKDELKDLDDLYSFVECVDSFAQLEDQEFYQYHIMGNRQAHVFPFHDRSLIHHRRHVYPFHDRSLIHHRRHVYPFHDQTSLVHSRAYVYHFPDQIPPSNLQGKGPSSIEVCVPTVDGRVIIEIIVESFFGEKVASLKEKIIKVIQIPSKYLKLRGKSVGVLREDKSLADNNVGAGEILTATWRFSRWKVLIA